VGVCCSYNYWKYDKRKKIDQPCIDLVPVENFRFDPAADWRDVVNTSRTWIHMIPMYVKDVKGRMQREEAKTQQLKWKEAPDTVIRQAMVGYADSTRQLREDKRPDSATGDRAINDFDGRVGAPGVHGDRRARTWCGTASETPSTCSPSQCRSSKCTGTARALHHRLLRDRDAQGLSGRGLAHHEGPAGRDQRGGE
jgi:hypothetical protein